MHTVPEIPYPGSVVFPTCEHPLHVTVEANCCHILWNAIIIDERVWIHGVQVEHSDVLIPWRSQTEWVTNQNIVQKTLKKERKKERIYYNSIGTGCLLISIYNPTPQNNNYNKNWKQNIKKQTNKPNLTKLHQKIHFVPVLHHLTEIRTKSVNVMIKLSFIQWLHTDDTLSTPRHTLVHYIIIFVLGIWIILISNYSPATAIIPLSGVISSAFTCWKPVLRMECFSQYY